MTGLTSALKDLTAAQGTVIGALIAGTVVAVGWFVTRPRRHGRWESIRNDLEIVKLLPDDDPYRQWLLDYCRLRLVAYSASETDRLWTPPGRVWAVLIAAMLFMVGTGFGVQYVLSQNPEIVGWDYLYPRGIPLVVCGIGTIVCVDFMQRWKPTHRLPVVKLGNSDRERLTAELQSLGARIRAIVRAQG